MSPSPIGFLGGVDPETGVIVERGHPLEGRSVAGRVLVFPTGKGSTVGSYTLYRLSRNGLAPAAIINAQSEAIVAVGAIISDIPMVDQVDISLLRDGDYVIVDDGVVTVERVDLGKAGRFGHNRQAEGGHGAPAGHRPPGPRGA